MEQRALGRTGMSVSEIGFGAWGIGGGMWVGAQEDESVRALRRAVELGIDLVDTARGYADSERIVGSVVRDTDGWVKVATKVPPQNGQWPARRGVPVEEAFPGAHIRASLQESLRQSGLERFDVLQFHVWDDSWVGQGDWEETVASLKSEGLIGAFGVSVNDHQPSNALALVRSGLVDTVQVIYNVFHQEPEEELFPACQEHGVGVIVRVALDEGGLTGRVRADTEFPPGDFRGSYFGGDRRRQVQEHVDALVADLGVEPDELPSIALRFVLAAPAVSTVIPGMRTVRNVERNAALGDLPPLTPEQLDVLRRHRWERNFYEPA